MVGVKKSDAVGFDELQKALRLALELRELPAGSELQQRHALEGLTALVGAQVGLWLHVDGFGSGAEVIRCGPEVGWPSDSDRRASLTHVEAGPSTALDPGVAPLTRSVSEPISTFIREQLLDDRAWVASDHMQLYRRVARLDNCIYAIYAPGNNTAACLALHRTWGAPPFSERERRLVDLFHRECAFLHEPPSDLAPAVLRGLSPRMRETLRGLARGRSEKQLAIDLGLSPHTIHDYVKTLHRHFGVQSRSELLARCLTGHGGHGRPPRDDSSSSSA